MKELFIPQPQIQPQYQPERTEGLGKEQEIVQHPQALERAEQIIEDGRIQIDLFKDLYGAEVIAKDTAYVEKRKAQFSANDFRDTDHKILSERSKIFEAMLFQEGDGAMWFGEDSAIIMPSEYDDICNGVDSVVEIMRQEGLSTAALSIDLTFKRDIGSKVDSIANKVKQGVATKIKYYQSELGDLRGEISKVPHFVTGVNGRTLGELTNLFAERKSAQFADHPVQFQIIESIMLQAKTFAQVAESSGHGNLVKSYERIGRIFKEIYENRNEVVKDDGRRDSFFFSLQRELNILERSL